jgi:hypothetical protein
MKMLKTYFLKTIQWLVVIIVTIVVEIAFLIDALIEKLTGNAQ